MCQKWYGFSCRVARNHHARRTGHEELLIVWEHVIYVLKHRVAERGQEQAA